MIKMFMSDLVAEVPELADILHLISNLRDVCLRESFGLVSVWDIEAAFPVKADHSVEA